MKLRLPAALVMIAAAAVLCGCGKGAGSPNGTAAGAPAGDGGGSAPGPAGAPAAGTAAAAADCSYISPAQVSSIEGATYAAPTAAYGICTWPSDSNGVSITLTRNATEAQWLDVLSMIQRDQATDPPTPIPGLGDRAAGTGQEIAVEHGGTIIDIRNGDSPGYGKWPKSTAIANAIIVGLH